MPIPRARFERQSLPLGERILDFLKSQPDAGWSLVEIVMRVEGLANEVEATLFLSRGKTASQGSPIAEYQAAVEDLRRRSLVAAVTDGGLVHYMAVPGAVWSPDPNADVPF